MLCPELVAADEQLPGAPSSTLSATIVLATVVGELLS